MSAAPKASLYVHAPFCRAKCRACAFFSEPLGPDSLGRYLPALLSEIDHWGRILGRVDAPTLFFGGGTPSLLGADALGRIFMALRENFALAPDAEISLEANPDSASPESLAAARGLGVNRLSLGVQSLDDGALAALGRVHDARQAVEAYHAARAAGFDNVGLDLIFGLPGQSVDQWLATLRQAVALGPEHLSCYGLTVEPGTPLALDAAALASLPGEDAQAEMFLRGAELLEASGYEHYEISNFARPGRACRHNQACWEGLDCLGLGPAASSTLEGVRWANPPDVDAWARSVGSGTVGQGSREELMLALRTAAGLDLADHSQRTGRDLAATRAALLRDLERAGLVTLVHGRLALTRAGMLVSSSVIRALGFEQETENFS
jgi:oxygen-independent coproporphyrinogen-3 oxidase